MKLNPKAERLVRELETIVDKLFPEVRRETGRFHSGVCTLHGRTVLFINSSQTADERIAALASAIARCDINGIYLKPAIRAEVERYAPAAQQLSDH